MGVDHPIPARWNRNRLMISGKIFYWSCDWYECQVNDILKRSIDTLRLIIFIPSRVPISPRNTQVLTDSLAASRNDHDNNKTLECRSFIICFRHNESNRWGSCRVKNQRNVEFLWSRCKYLITRIVTYATFLVLILRHCFTFLWFRYFSLIIAEEDHWRIPGKWTHWKPRTRPGTDLLTGWKIDPDIITPASKIIWSAQTSRILQFFSRSVLLGVIIRGMCCVGGWF